jgi:hypothetical protein
MEIADAKSGVMMQDIANPNEGPLISSGRRVAPALSADRIWGENREPSYPNV